MCLLAIAYKVHRRYPLVVLANRDEFLDRPSQPLHFWSGSPHILAGRDLLAGGTWMGLTLQGRFAALTNHRDMRLPMVAGRSRGELVTRVLNGDGDALKERSGLAGFHLLHGTVNDIHYSSNVGSEDQPLSPGIHGMSNGGLNSAWPKVHHARRGLKELLLSTDPIKDRDPFFRWMQDTTVPAVEELPDTGVGATWERILGSVFVRAGNYGTRGTTLLVVDEHGSALVEERGYHPVSNTVHSVLLQAEQS